MSGGDGNVARLAGVTKRFEGTGERPVLDGVDLEVAAGETVAVVGPSGSGKSTLLNVVGGLEAPSSGTVEVCGRALAGLGDAELARLRNRELGFVFQHHLLLPQCTALENVLVPTLASREREPGVEERARGLLERVGLGARLDHRPATLSGGERQRVAVVRALINGPRLVLADEPTGSLDAASAAALGDLFVELNREEGVAFLLVTHALDLAARMGRVLELRAGHLHAHVPA